MAIQRMYSGKGGAVEFDRPSITPTEISQQYGRSMTDILKYKQTMKQRRLENLTEMTKFGDMSDVVEEDREIVSGMMDETMQANARILQGSEGAKDYDFSREELGKVQAGMTSFESRAGAIVSGRNQQLEAIKELRDDSKAGEFDWDASMEKIEEFNKTHKVPQGGFLVSAPVNTAALIDEVSRKVRKLNTDEYTSEDIGDSVVILRGNAYFKKDIETQTDILLGESRAKKPLLEAFGDKEGITRAIEESLVPLGETKIAAHKKKEETDLGTARSIPGASTNPDYKVLPSGAEEKHVTGKDGGVDVFDVPWVNTIQGFKGQAKLTLNGILKTSDEDIPNLKAGERLGEKSYPKSDEIKGGELANHSFKIVEAPTITGYPTASEDIIVYEMTDDGKIKTGRVFGGKKEEFRVKKGEQVTREQLRKMSDAQRKLVTATSFVDIIAHTSAYGNFTVSEPLTREWKRILSISDKAYDNYQKGYSAEGAPEEGADIYDNVYNPNK